MVFILIFKQRAKGEIDYFPIGRSIEFDIEEDQEKIETMIEYLYQKKKEEEK